MVAACVTEPVGSELMVPSNRLAEQRTAGRHKEIKRIAGECPACPERRTAL
jgi:hypothetical protein